MTYSTLISAPQLADLIAQQQCVVVDCRFDLMKPQAGMQAYQAGHIPGARYANLDDDLASKKYTGSGRHPLPDVATFTQRLGSWGITPATQVVVYDDAGGAIAARLWWMLHHWLRHAAVAVLDGGLRAWQEGGYALSQDPVEVMASHYNAVADDRCWVNADFVMGLANGAGILLDARAEPRFQGKVEPIDPVAGHIPWARNHAFSRNLDEQGRFLVPEILRERFAQDAAVKGVTGPVVNMCGSGVTACHNILCMEHAGIPGALLYVGSWSGWIDPPGRPIEKSAAK